MRNLGHKRAYHMYSDVIFGWVLWIWLSSWHFFLSILILFCDCLQEKIETLVVPRAPRRALGTTKVPIFFLQAIAKQNQNTQKKVPTTQPNPQYSAKNNVTIHMIAPFMPKCNCHYCQTLSFIIFLCLY